MPARLDIAGHRFGRLTAFTRDSQGKWRCRCDCGMERRVALSSLRSGATTSCGCLHRERASARPIARRRLAKGEAGFNRLLRHYQRNAKVRGFTWMLTAAEFRDLATGNCTYCGAAPTSITTHSRGPRLSEEARKHAAYLHGGIDRIDSSQGYETNNVVSCCTDCNLAKLDRNQSEFIAWIHRAHVHLLSKSTPKENE